MLNLLLSFLKAVTHPFIFSSLKLSVLSFKVFFITELFKAKIHTKVPPRLGYSLLISLIVNSLGDVLGILYLSFKYFSDSFLINQIASIFRKLTRPISIAEGVLFALFINGLIQLDRGEKLSRSGIAFSIVGVFLLLCQLIFIVFPLESLEIMDAFFDIDLTVYRITIIYSLAVLTITLYYALKSIQSNVLPRILTAQLRALLMYALTPYIAIGCIIFLITFFSDIGKQEFYPIFGLSAIAVNYIFYICSRRIMKLRFLNLYEEVQVKYDSEFIKYFNDALAGLAKATALYQVETVTKNFVREAFEIPFEKTLVFVRPLRSNQSLPELDLYQEGLQLAIENHLANTPQNQALRALLEQSKILVLDDLEFTYFYQPDELVKRAITFLKSAEAEVFLPIYDKHFLIGYVLICQGARTHKLYSAVDKEEMIAMAIYLERVINLLQHANPELVLKKQKALNDELKEKDHELSLYKDALLSFNKHRQDRKIGIVQYKNRHFRYINSEAKQVLPVDLDNEAGHYITQTLKGLAEQIKEEGTPQVTLSHDHEGNPLFIRGVPNTNDNSIIFVVMCAEIGDILNYTLPTLPTSADWDYALFLQTTKAGKRINELIPGATATLTQFKVNLLRAAISEKPLFLHIPEEDVAFVADIIHYTSSRTYFEVLEVVQPERNNEIGLKLLGSNPLLERAPKERPFLEKLNALGTLLIKNIDLLHVETQMALVEYLRYGFFHPLRSDRRIETDVRLILSSTKDIKSLVHEGQFSLELAEELSQWTVSLPLISELPIGEQESLIESYRKQIVHHEAAQTLLEFTSKEKASIIEKKPSSLDELRQCVHFLIAAKAVKKKIPDFSLDDVPVAADPELQKAALLGKNALKDVRIITMLWQKFKSQTKIANFLGVNRSSVHKRCKEYNLS